MKPHHLEETLAKLKLFGMLETLETRLAQATAGDLGHIELLQSLCEDEAARRDATGIERRLKAARFEQTAAIEDFDFSFNPKIPAAQIRDLATLRFVEAGESVILHGPVGVGKSMIAQALGHQACRRGYSGVSPRLLDCSPTAVGTRTGASRAASCAGAGRASSLRRFAMRDFTLAQADDLYELITARVAKSSIFTANRQASDCTACSPIRWWPRSILDRIVNFGSPRAHGRQSYRPNKRPGMTTTGQANERPGHLCRTGL